MHLCHHAGTEQPGAQNISCPYPSAMATTPFPYIKQVGEVIQKVQMDSNIISEINESDLKLVNGIE